jgi:GTP-binding protein
MAKNNLFIGNFSLQKSAYNVEQLKFYSLPQFLLFGRSNVGKSSLINSLCQQKNLAKTSKTPGRTASLNFFINQKKNLLLVDLPGYGFTSTSKAESQNWEKLILSHIKENNYIFRAFILIDIRRGLMEVDMIIINLLIEHNISFQIVLTKGDKVKKLEIDNIIKKITLSLKKIDLFYEPILVVSNLKNLGFDALRNSIFNIYQNNENN